MPEPSDAFAAPNCYSLGTRGRTSRKTYPVEERNAPNARGVPVSSAALALAMALLAARGAAAQDTTKARLDSLARQLERAEARLEVLEKQVSSQAAGGVATRSGARMELSGRFLVNGFFNTRRVNNVDDPQFVRPDTASAVPVRGLGMSPRQTTIRIAVIVPEIAHGSAFADVETDFYGGQLPSSGGRTFPLIRLRTSRIAIRWPHAELMAGQDVPLIAPLNPASVAAVGTPDFATAGNLWLWLPQLRATVERGSGVRIGLQGAVLAPTSGDPAASFDTDFDAAERSQRPYLQARGRVRWGENETAGEVGCGGHVGWIAVPAGSAPGGASLVKSRAGACDLRVGLTSKVEIRGEAYDGQALRGLGGGGIGQGVGPGSLAVRDRGGWAQLNVKPVFWLALGAGCGMDDPNDADLPATGRLKNVGCATYAQVHGPGPLMVGAEARRLETSYASGGFVNDHLNLYIGFSY